MKGIYVLGSLNCDLTIRAPYLPERGETLKGSDFLMTAGGKGANQAYACAKLGGTVKMAGAVGKDAFGDMLLESLRGVGVDISCIRSTDKSTGVAVITVIGGDNRIILSEGANGVVDEDDVQNLLRDAREGDIFVTQLENPYPVVLYGLRISKEKGLYTVFNPAPAREDVLEAIGYADLILPNISLSPSVYLSIAPSPSPTSLSPKHTTVKSGRYVSTSLSSRARADSVPPPEMPAFITATGTEGYNVAKMLLTFSQYAFSG